MLKKALFFLLICMEAILASSFDQLSIKYKKTHAQAVVAYENWTTVMNGILEHTHELSTSQMCALYCLQSKKPECCKSHERAIVLRLQERKDADSNKLAFIDETLCIRIHAYGVQVRLLEETVQTLNATLTGFLSRVKTS